MQFAGTQDRKRLVGRAKVWASELAQILEKLTPAERAEVEQHVQETMRRLAALRPSSTGSD